MELAAGRSNREHGRFWYFSFLWLAAVLLAVPAARADIYFWQDDQGVIHFSNQDAPPEASLYMREPEPVAAAPVAPTPASEPAAIQQEMRATLERANRKLEQALERVDELKDQVRDSQQEAAVAAALANQAAEFSIAGAAQAAREADREVSRRVLYYAVPSVNHSLSRHGGFHGKSSHFSHRKFKHLNKFNRHKGITHHNKFKRLGRTTVHRQLHHRIKNGIHHKARPSGLHRTRIPKAYGIR